MMFSAALGEHGMCELEKMACIGNGFLCGIFGNYFGARLGAGVPDMEAVSIE